MNITVSKLVKDFEDRIRTLDLRRNIHNLGKQPEFPMIVIFLGEEAMKGYLDIVSRLFQLWPSYQNALCFVGVTGTAEDIGYYRLSQGDGETERRSLQENEVRELAESLTDRKNNFHNNAEKRVYYVFHTAELSDASGFDTWMELYLKVKGLLDLCRKPELFVFMLDEKGEKQRKIAAAVRKSIADEKGLVSQALLLSNRDSGNGTTDDWTSCYEIAANVIALTNNSDSRITEVLLFQKGIYTVSYVSEKKPTKEIGMVIATEMIKRLIELQGSAAEDNPFHDPDIEDRLGLSRNRTLKIVDSYAENQLFQQLPEEEQLHLFPRMDDTFYEDIIPCSAKEFNEITLNAWQCYLEKILKGAKEKITGDLSLAEEWKRDYEKYLKDTFSVNELIILGDNLEKVRSIFRNRNHLAVGEGILESAKREIEESLSSDPMILDMFIDIVAKCGNEAKESFDVWGRLLDSMGRIPPVHDQTIIHFYNQRIKKYFGRKENTISSELKEITDQDKLDSFLKKTMNEIIDSDSAVFLATFDQERAERLKMEENLSDINDDLQKKLTDSTNMQKYLYILNGYSNTPTVSAIMLKFGTSLEKYLKKNSKGTYYYDTGNSNSAEVIEIYQVDQRDI